MHFWIAAIAMSLENPAAGAGSAPSSTAAPASSLGPQPGTQQTALSDVVLKALRKKRYVHPTDLRKAVKKEGYKNEIYAPAMADLRDRNFVIIWVWEKRCYTINPTFHELYRWCLANYRAIMTILRRTKPALAQGNRMAKLMRQKAYQESKKYFLAIYRHMAALRATNKNNPVVMPNRKP